MGPGWAYPEAALTWLRSSKPSASSASLLCDLRHCALPLCAQLILDPWTLRLPGCPTMQGWVAVAV